MSRCRPVSFSFFLRLLKISLPVFCVITFIADPQAFAQAIPKTSDTRTSDAAHMKGRNEWIARGRIVPGKSSAELRRRAYQAKMKMRMRAATIDSANPQTAPTGAWTPLGPVPLASDATGLGIQDYHQVAGRATAVAVDPADPTGNTVYVGGAQGGIWKSINAANAIANNVAWTPVADYAATLAIGALAIEPGNTIPANTVILAATGEADNTSDSYFGLGILRSANAGTTWTLATTANGGALSLSGLGGTRIAFNTATGQTNVVVAALAATAEGLIEGKLTSGTKRGLYTSLDAGQTWTYDLLSDPGGATDATSAPSVVYNPGAALFFAAIRYHGFYSSPDGTHWARLSAQPGGSALSATACPAISTSNGQTCPLYRAEITALPGRNEMYAWFVSISPAGVVVDGGIWQSLNGGTSWTSISDTAIANCGDVAGCGVQQGAYDLELLALPNGAATDLYAGATNIYKCSITTLNPNCAVSPFLNLTHVYGCDPVAALAHVHPDQHALAYMIPGSGSDSGKDLMYFANDGGIYRALDGFTGLVTGSCSGTNQFDDLNQSLGSMTQFVSFAQHPTDPNTLLGGTQGNGSPATGHATTSLSWGNVLGGDGAYTAIDPNVPDDFYAANPDVPPGGLAVQSCTDGVNCAEGNFYIVAGSNTVGGDDGDFYFPYILDPQSATALLVGTCRVWRGPRGAGVYTVLSPNFDTLGAGICSGSEVNLVRSITAGGPTDANGSLVVYATTSGPGLASPPSSPAGGRVWVSTNATAGPSSFSDVTGNGSGGSINPNQFPISSSAIDSSDATGATAYVTVMGFTGGTGHVWKTTNAGAAWIDFTGNLPDSPVNAVVVDPVNDEVYVGTDVGVFAAATSAPSWTELGPVPGPGQVGFLPNVAVTALGLFNAGGQEILRAATYGRGIWQFPIKVIPDYSLLISNSPLTAFSGQASAFSGTLSAVNGYASSVAITCGSGGPSTCSVPQSPMTPGNAMPFNVTVAGIPGDYSFNVQGVGADSSHLAHSVGVTLHLVSFALSTPTPATVTVPRGTTSALINFNVTAAGSFNQAVAIACTTTIVDAVCALTPGTSVNPTSSTPVAMTASVMVPVSTVVGNYPVTIHATSAGSSVAVTAQFTLAVTTNPDFVVAQPAAFPEVNAGSAGISGPISITAQDGFTGTVALSCPTTFGANSCSIAPATVSVFPATATLTINGSSFVAGKLFAADQRSLGVELRTRFR